MESVDKFISRVYFLFGATATSNCILIAMIYIALPGQRAYISSLLPAHLLKNWLVIISFTMYELIQYLSNWGTVLFYVFYALIYFSIMATWLKELK